MDAADRWMWMGRSFFTMGIVCLLLGLVSELFIFLAIILFMLYCLVGIHLHVKYGR